jgi:hypothetical protein
VLSIDEVKGTPMTTRDTPDAASVFYDGVHDGCGADYRHNHSTAPLVDALTPSERALIDAVLGNPTTHDVAEADPFYDELRLHGKRPKRPFDNALRDRVRESAEDCARCRALIEALDAALMGSFLDGTGPFA